MVISMPIPVKLPWVSTCSSLKAFDGLVAVDFFHVIFFDQVEHVGKRFQALVGILGLGGDRGVVPEQDRGDGNAQGDKEEFFQGALGEIIHTNSFNGITSGDAGSPKQARIISYHVSCRETMVYL